jgi:dienelactone hydrolase
MDLRSWWPRLRNLFSRQWNNIRPGPAAKRGAVRGTLAAAAIAVVFAGLFLHTGFGYLADFTFAIVVAALVIPLTALLIVLLLTILRSLPRRETGIILGATTAAALIWGPPQLDAAMGAIVGLSAGLLGAALATFASGEYRQAALSKKIVTIVLCAVALFLGGGVIFLLTCQGSMEDLIVWKAPANTMPPKLAAADPSARGTWRVKTLTYGSGTDIRRPEYGAAVAIKTRSVDASNLFDDFDGWKRWVRRKYWGFDIDKLPLNARVWYPDGAGPFPLVLIVHGNHQMSEFSDPGYAYLGELLASRGFIVASIDENFLNTGLFHDPPKQQAVRGWMLLEHLKLWREWNSAAGNPFRGKADLTRIALIGHSRGGEAVATAALFNRLKYDPEDASVRFDYNFGIQSVIAIAPVDGQYKPAGEFRHIRDVNYLTLQGAHDSDVAHFLGSRQWDHVVYTGPGPWFKAEIYAYRANHGQFNTVWGRRDHDLPLGWLINVKPLLAPDQQRRIAKTYISAFLEATLQDRRQYLPLFEDWRTGRDWLPDTIYFNRYRDASYADLASFNEDADLTTTTAPGGRIDGRHLSIWHEGRIPWRDGDREYNGVFLGWNRGAKGATPTYTLTLPPNAASDWKLDAGSTVELSVAPLDEDAPEEGKKDTDGKEAVRKENESPDFTVELVSANGAVVSAAASRFAAIPPPLTEKLLKLDVINDFAYKQNWEAIFQSVRIPLSAFQGAPGFDPAHLSIVRLKFDRTANSVLCISGIGFGRVQNRTLVPGMLQ